MLYVNSIPTPRMCIVGKKTTDIYNVGLRGYNAYKALHFLVIVYNIFSRWRINFIIKHLTQVSNSFHALLSNRCNIVFHCYLQLVNPCPTK